MQYKHPINLLMWLSLAGCVNHAADQPRSWLDNETAVTITAQRAPLVFARDEFASGVNVRDYAEAGCFEINRSGKRKIYLGLVLWSTVNRNAEQLAESDALFANLVLQANDRPIALQRTASTRQALGVSTEIFPLPAPGTREAYYELTAEQLNAIASARTVALKPGNDAVQSEQVYKPWRGDMSELIGFRAELVGRTVR